jgi:hypothetical protein
MNLLISSFVIGVLVLIVLGLVVLLVVMYGRRYAGGNITVYSSIQHMRSMGQLSVFKVITKEIVTETDHSWGEFGAKYLRWVISDKKMAMIFEFEIDFRYDLRRPEFEIIGASNNSYIIKMPPCLFEVHIRDIKFYDEQKARLFPWLLPDFLNGFLPLGFSEGDKNNLVASANSHAKQQAIQLITNLQSEVQNSAKLTLQSISRAFGAQNVAFEFLPQGEIKLEVGVAGRVAA